MKVLVLGGCGFIGSHVVDSLVRSGHKVKVFTRSLSYINEAADYVVADFADQAKLQEALQGIDVVIHSISATVPATSALDPVFDIEVNLINTVKLLEKMSLMGVNKIVYLSSGGTVYGNVSKDKISETEQLLPVSSYGAVKVAIEKFISVYSAKGISSVILRPSNPYGERQGHKGSQGLISTLLNNYLEEKSTLIYGDGTISRDYIYIADLVSAICRVCESFIPGVYNIGTGKGITVNEIISVVQDVVGDELAIEYSASRVFDVEKVVLDSSRVSDTFNWAIENTINQGVMNQWQWLKG